MLMVLSSLQHAGKHLRELQKTLKNPVSNFGLVLTEGIKRSQRCVQYPILYIHTVCTCAVPLCSCVPGSAMNRGRVVWQGAVTGHCRN